MSFSLSKWSLCIDLPITLICQDICSISIISFFSSERGYFEFAEITCFCLLLRYRRTGFKLLWGIWICKSPCLCLCVFYMLLHFPVIAYLDSPNSIWIGICSTQVSIERIAVTAEKTCQIQTTLQSHVMYSKVVRFRFTWPLFSFI